jgi:hypothetical protein
MGNTMPPTGKARPARPIHYFRSNTWGRPPDYALSGMQVAKQQAPQNAQLVHTQHLTGLHLFLCSRKTASWRSSSSLPLFYQWWGPSARCASWPTTRIACCGASPLMPSYW